MIKDDRDAEETYLFPIHLLVLVFLLLCYCYCLIVIVLFTNKASHPVSDLPIIIIKSPKRPDIPDAHMMHAHDTT